ncbi:MAG: alpha/beta hydrolase [Betaproteobacteria bacterium]|nr:alpha/beta hydrolase [Betaproteobacteria bacterium]
MALDIDPELLDTLDEISARRPSGSLDTTADIAAKRAQSNRLTESLNAALDRSGVVTEVRNIPGPSRGSSLQLRIHRPTTAVTGLPCLYSVHSGGMVSGSALGDDRILVPMVKAFGCVGASVDYRLAPEFRAPAATEDCYCALAWLAANAGELNIDPARIAIHGVSGGGGIAATTVLKARDQGGPMPCLQLLVYPQLDDRNTTPSSHGDWLGWTRAMNVGAWRAALGERAGTADVTAYEAAARATDLAGLPPTFIDVGSMEVFRDECIDYAERLLRAGVATELHVYPGCFHGFDIYVPQARVSRTAVAARQSALSRAWWPQGRP